MRREEMGGGEGEEEHNLRQRSGCVRGVGGRLSFSERVMTVRQFSSTADVTQT